MSQVLRFPDLGATKGTYGTRGTTKGTKGTLGTQGKGTKGTKGAKGTFGTFGAKGTKGTKATKGTQGTKGTTATKGTRGTQGMGIGWPAARNALFYYDLLRFITKMDGCHFEDFWCPELVMDSAPECMFGPRTWQGTGALPGAWPGGWAAGVRWVSGGQAGRL